MHKYSFFNDYSELAHPNVLEAIQKENLNQDAGYGYDEVSKRAKKLILGYTKTNSDVYFLSGGTQTNLIAISSVLRPFESVISASSGHIHVHEAGAIEATGHKVEDVYTADGKLTVAHISSILDKWEDEHMTVPKMVYISNTTELGTVYTKTELEILYGYCVEKGLYLFLDGARLGGALMAQGAELDLEIIAKNTDMFYIGGTKNGALLGESLVVTNEKLKPNIINNIKQKGGLLAKGKVLGIQFEQLFSNNLYFDLAKHANDMGFMLASGIKELGYTFLTDSKTNQIFPIFSNEIIEKLKNDYGFNVWSKVDENTSATRFVTSWATPQTAVEMFLNDLKQF